MKALRSPLVTVALMLTACATAVTEDLPDEEGSGGGSAGTLADGGTASTAGKSSIPTAGTTTTSTAGTATNAFGGTSSSAGKSSGGASGSGGGSAGASAGGTSSAGTGGKAAGGSAGTGSGGKAGAGSGGATGTSGSGGSGGSVVVGTGSCSGTAAFALGSGSKYDAAAKVVAVCNGGTPCTMATPAGAAGKTYEFSCLDKYNCGSQDPGTTNWSQPPWQLTKACTP